MVVKVCLEGHIYLSSLLLFWRIFVKMAKSKEVEDVDEGVVEENVRL